MSNQSKIKNKKLHSGERTIAQTLENLTSVQLYRYVSTYKYIKSSDIVADLGCGTGYGCHLLAKKAKHVIGIDDSLETIEFAKLHWKSNKITYKCQNILDIKEKYDCVVIHEVIEHVKDVNQLFKILSQCTKRYLIFTVPSPHQKQTNKFHWKHYHPDEIKQLLTQNNFKLIRFDGMTLPFYVGKKI